VTKSILILLLFMSCEKQDKSFEKYMIGSWSIKKDNIESVLEFTPDSLLQYDIENGDVKILARNKISFSEDNKIIIEDFKSGKENKYFFITKTGSNLIKIKIGDEELPIFKRVTND